MWPKIERFFRNSATIAWARIQWFLGIVGAGLIAAFSGYDFNQLLNMNWRDAFKMLALVALTGIVTELCRRRTAPIPSLPEIPPVPPLKPPGE